MNNDELKALLNDVLVLLQKAEYKATGEDVMRITAVIQAFHKWATEHTAEVPNG